MYRASAIFCRYSPFFIKLSSCGLLTKPTSASTEGIDTIVSSSLQNVSTITLNLRLNANPDRAMTDVLSKINQVKSTLPREALDDSALNNYEIVPDLERFRPEDWDDFYDTVVRPNVMEKRPRGQYAAAARKRKKAEGADGAEG